MLRWTCGRPSTAAKDKEEDLVDGRMLDTEALADENKKIDYSKDNQEHLQTENLSPQSKDQAFDSANRKEIRVDD